MSWMRGVYFDLFPVSHALTLANDDVSEEEKSFQQAKRDNESPPATSVGEKNGNNHRRGFYLETLSKCLSYSVVLHQKGRMMSPIICVHILFALTIVGLEMELGIAFAPIATTGVHRVENPSGLWMVSESPNSAEQEANDLKEQARKLREEIEAFQQKKDSLEEDERRKVQEKLDAKQAFIDKYSAVVPILKPDGSTLEEKVQFPPRLVPRTNLDDASDESSGEETTSSIFVVEAPLPLGIILGEHETIPGMTAVDEVAEGSNGEAAGIQVGDLLRACTACRVEMDQPMWQLMAGGIGRPKTMRYMFSTDYQAFEQVMEALGSNRMDPEERSVLLVVERMTES